MGAGSSWFGLAVGAGALAVAGAVAVATRGAAPARPIRSGPDHPSATTGVPPHRNGTETPPPKPPPIEHEGPPPSITVDAVYHDFGKILQGSDPVATFHFSNAGPGTLRILDIKPNCACEQVGRAPRELAPGASGALEIRLKTAPLLGRVVKAVDLFTNDPAQPMVRLRVAAEIRRIYQVDPPSFLFGEVQRGVRTTRVVAVRHVDGLPFTIQDLQGPPPGMTLRELPPDPATPEVHRLELAIGETWAADTSNGRVTIRTDPAPAVPLWIAYSARAARHLRADPWQLRFGRVAHGAKPTRTVRLTAGDGKPFAVTQVRVLPAGSLVVTHARDGKSWVFTAEPGPTWPAEGGNLAGAIRVRTDRFELEAVIPFSATQLLKG